jgi:hypothetical protein
MSWGRSELLDPYAATTTGSTIVRQNSPQLSCAVFRSSAPSGRSTSKDRYKTV